ncbi:MAG: cob(I)yrinic acid a,c-diamide adenosyltransferase [bacterium]|jgi:cob(I)alamin adenosyltransferase
MESRTLDERGCVHVYYGDSKGKTTAAIGLTIRAVGFGRRVAFIQFDKGFDKVEHYNERKVLRSLERVTLIPTGRERMMPDGSFRFENTEEDRAEARKGVGYVTNAIRDGRYFLVVADEILSALMTGLIPESEVMHVLDVHAEKPLCELVLTGRVITDAIAERADLITEFKSIKHYFNKGRRAKEGIEY